MNKRINYLKYAALLIVVNFFPNVSAAEAITIPSTDCSNGCSAPPSYLELALSGLTYIGLPLIILAIAIYAFRLNKKRKLLSNLMYIAAVALLIIFAYILYESFGTEIFNIVLIFAYWAGLPLIIILTTIVYNSKLNKSKKNDKKTKLLKRNFMMLFSVELIFSLMFFIVNYILFLN